MSARVGLDHQERRRAQAGNNSQRNSNNNTNYNSKSARGRGGGANGSSRRRGDSPSAASTTSTASDIDAINAELEDADYFRDDAIEANFLTTIPTAVETSSDAAVHQLVFHDAARQQSENARSSHGGDPNAVNAVLYDPTIHPSRKFQSIAQNFLKRLTKPANALEKSAGDQNALEGEFLATQQTSNKSNNAGFLQQSSSKKAAAKADKRKAKHSNDTFYRDWRITFNVATQQQHDQNGVLYNAYDLFMLGNDVGQNVIRNVHVRNAYANMFLVWFTNYLQHLFSAVKQQQQQLPTAGANDGGQRLHTAVELPVLSIHTRGALMQIFTDPTRVSVLSLLNKLLLTDADKQFAKQIFLQRVHDVLSCHYIFVYAFQTAQIIRAFVLYDDVMLSPSEAAIEPRRDPIEPLVKLMNSMVMVGGNAAAFLVDFVDKQPTLQYHLARTLDMIVGQYERYEHDWHQLKQENFFAHSDGEKAMLLAQKAGKQPLVKKEIVSQVYALMRRYSLPPHIAEFSEYQRKFSYITYLLYNFDKESQLPTHEDVRFEEKVDAVCANNDVLRKNFLEYLLTRRKFDIFVTLYVLWFRRLPSGTAPLQIPSFVQRQVREKTSQKQDQDDVDRQLWHVVQSRTASSCALSEYCREHKSLGGYSMQEGFSGNSNSEYSLNPWTAEANIVEQQPKTLRYLPLDLTFAQVKFVSTRTELLSFIDQLRTMAQDFRAKTLLKQQATGEVSADAAILVGIDCEWFDDMGVSNENLSLIQIGMGDRVFIVDMLRILAELSAAVITSDERREIWSKFSHTLFLDPIFRKILYSGQHDFTVLGRIDGFVEPSDYSKQNIIDLYQIFRILKVYKPACLGLRDDEQCGSGLKDLTRLVLGAELDKTEQTSGWLRRPLRLMQVIYAALDAHVLILLYEKLKKNCAREGVPFPPNVSDAHRLANANVTVQQHSTNSSNADADVAAVVAAVTPDNIRILVEAHLLGLARQLRSCGIDTLVAGEGEQRRVTVRRAVEQNRTLVGTNDMRGQYKECLLDDQLYLLLPRHVQQKRCRDQCKYVLQYFNVVVREEDLLTRCVGCNGVRYIRITREQLRVHWQRHHDEEETRLQRDEEQRKQDQLNDWGYDYGAVASSNNNKTTTSKFGAKSTSDEAMQQQQSNDTAAAVDDDEDDDEEDEDGKALTDVSKHYRFVSKTTPVNCAKTTERDVTVRDVFDNALPYSDELVDIDGYIRVSGCDGSNSSSSTPAKLKFGAIPEAVLESVGLFFVCMQCGKIYWNGTHYTRIRNSFLADMAPPPSLLLAASVKPTEAVSSVSAGVHGNDTRVLPRDRHEELGTANAHVKMDDGFTDFFQQERDNHNPATSIEDDAPGVVSDAEISEQIEVLNDAGEQQVIDAVGVDHKTVTENRTSRGINENKINPVDTGGATDADNLKVAAKADTARTLRSNYESSLNVRRQQPVERDSQSAPRWAAETVKSSKQSERFVAMPASGGVNNGGYQQPRPAYGHRYEEQQQYQYRPSSQPQQLNQHRQRSQQSRCPSSYNQPMRPPFDADRDGFKMPRGSSYDYGRGGNTGGNIMYASSSSSSPPPPRSRSECAESANVGAFTADTSAAGRRHNAEVNEEAAPSSSIGPGGAYSMQVPVAKSYNKNSSSSEQDETAGLSVYMRFGRANLSGNGVNGNSNKTNIPALAASTSSSSPTRTSIIDHYSPYEREGRLPPSMLQRIAPADDSSKNSVGDAGVKRGGYHAAPLNIKNNDAGESSKRPTVSEDRPPLAQHSQQGQSFSSYGRGWITDSFFTSARGRGGGGSDMPNLYNNNFNNAGPMSYGVAHAAPREYEERSGGRGSSGYMATPGGGGMANNHNNPYYHQPDSSAGVGRGQQQQRGGASGSGGRFNGKRPNEFYQQQQLQSMQDSAASSGNVNWRGECRPRE